MSNTREETFEDLLVKIGGFGKYQKIRLIILGCTACLSLGFVTIPVILMIQAPAHYCKYPYQSDNETESCSRKAIHEHYNTSLEDSRDEYLTMTDNWKKTKVKCADWEYEKTYGVTVASEWNLVCAMDYVPYLMITLDDVGGNIGTTFFGFFQDLIGRKSTYLLLQIVFLLFGISRAFSPNWMTFIVLQTGLYLASVSSYFIPMTMLLEMISPNKRTFTLNFLSIGTFLSYALCCLIAYLSPTWRILALASSASLIPLFLINDYLVSESPRWLIIHGKLDKANEVLQKIAKTNGKQIDNLSQSTKNLHRSFEDKKKEGQKSSKLGQYSALCCGQKHLTLITMILIFLTFTINLASSGINLMAVFFGKANKYLIFGILCLMDIPGVLFSAYALTKIGRIPFAFAAFGSTAATCFTMIYVESTASPVAEMITYLFGKFCAVCGFRLLLQIPSELYPTSVRGTGVAMGSSAGLISHFILPGILYLKKYVWYAPWLIFGLCCTAATILVLFLPETMGKQLSDVVQSYEELERSKSEGTLAGVSAFRRNSSTLGLDVLALRNAGSRRNSTSASALNNAFVMVPETKNANNATKNCDNNTTEVIAL